MCSGGKRRGGGFPPGAEHGVPPAWWSRTLRFGRPRVIAAMGVEFTSLGCECVPQARTAAPMDRVMKFSKRSSLCQRRLRIVHTWCGAGLDTGTVELTVKTLSSHLITRKSNSPTEFLRTPYDCVQP